MTIKNIIWHNWLPSKLKLKDPGKAKIEQG